MNETDKTEKLEEMRWKKNAGEGGVQCSFNCEEKTEPFGKGEESTMGSLVLQNLDRSAVGP